MDKRDEKKGRSHSGQGQGGNRGSESERSGEILGAGQGGPSRQASGSEDKGGGPSRHSKQGTQSEQSKSNEGMSDSTGKTTEDDVVDSSFTEGRESKGSSSRELGEGGERDSLQKKSSEEETDIDVSMGRGQYGGQEGQGRGAPGAGA